MHPETPYPEPHDTDPLAATDGWDSVERACQEYVELVRQGNEPTISDFAARYPELQTEIADVLPTVMLLEQVRSQRVGKRRDGRVTRGPESIDALGDYRIIGELGRGGMGIVYEAYQESLDRVVALKVLPRQSMSEAQIENFYSEASIVARLHHSNIVPIFTIGRDQGVCFYSMENIVGRPLDQWLEPTNAIAAPDHIGGSNPDLPASNVSLRPRRNRRGALMHRSGAHPILTDQHLPQPGTGFSVDQVVEIGLQISSALDYAHGQAVIHRDVKPANLILGNDGRLWLTDFGLAALRTRESNDAEHSSFSGTLRYVAPERIEHAPDAPSGDIYSLGVTLIELLTAQPAFAATRPAELTEQILQNQLLPIRRHGRSIPVDLDRILQKATHRDPAQRYPSAKAFHDDLLHFAHGEPVSAHPIGPIRRGWRWCQQNRALAAALTVVALLLLTISVVSVAFYVNSRDLLQTAEQERANANNASAVAHQVIEKIFKQLQAEDEIGDAMNANQPPVMDRGRMTDLLNQLTRFYEKMAHVEDTGPPSGVDPVSARRKVGTLHLKLGNYEDAILSFRAALTRFDAQRQRLHAEDAPSSAVQRADILNEIGQVHRIAGSVSGAMAEHRRAEATLTEWLQRFGANTAVETELAQTYYLMGRNPQRGTELDRYPRLVTDDRTVDIGDQSRRMIERAVEILERNLPESLPLSVFDSGVEPVDLDIRVSEAVPDQLHLLALCYRELVPQRWTDRTMGQLRKDQRSLGILRKLVQTYPSKNVYQFDLARGLAEFDVQDPAVSQVQLRAAQRSLSEAIDRETTLTKNAPGVSHYRAALIIAYARQGGIAQRRLEGSPLPDSVSLVAETRDSLRLLAENSWRSALNLQQKRLDGTEDSAISRCWAAYLKLQLATCRNLQSRFDEKRQLISDAILLLRQLPESDRRQASVRALLKRASKLSIASLADPATVDP